MIKDTAIDICQQYSHGEKALGQVQLENADLQEAQLGQIDLRKSKLDYSNLMLADLTDSDLRESSLVKTNLSRANLTGANFANANLSQANLTGANLIRANFAGANLSRANLSIFKFIDTKDLQSKQAQTSLEIASSNKVDFRYANLAGAFFIGSNLKIAHLEGAIYDDNTKLTPDFDPIARGMVHIRMVQHLAVEELLKQFNYLFNYSSRYLGNTITSKYFYASRPEFVWLDQFQINQSDQIVFEGTVSSFIEPEQLQWFQEWIEAFTNHCSKIIKDFPKLT